MFLRRSLLPVLLAGALGSCSLDSTGNGPAIALDLEVDRTTLPRDATMIITARARNVGVSTLTLTGPMDCLLFIEVFVSGNNSPLYSSAADCTGVAVTEEILAGGQKEQVFTWAGVSNNGTRLPEGGYSIRAVARVTGNGYAGPPLVIRLE